MKIVFATHDGVFLHKGGPYVKITNTKKSLEALGIDVRYINYLDMAGEMKNCDLVHLFGANMTTYVTARNIKTEGVPFVVNPIIYSRHNHKILRIINGLDLTVRKIARGFWWDYGFTRDICNWSKRVLPNTIDEGKLIIEGLGVAPEKFDVIHNGVSGEFRDADPTLFKKKYGLENFILTVGHMGPDRKNVMRLVKALAKIDHPAVFIGKKIQMHETAVVLEEAKKNPNLLILDALPNDSPLLASAYAACDTFLLPSKFETPGRAALEAALAGAKIVITPHGGTYEYFEDKANYVDPYSIESIRFGVEKALNASKDPGLSDHIFNNFTWEKIAVKTVDVYKKVLAIS